MVLSLNTKARIAFLLMLSTLSSCAFFRGSDSDKNRVFSVKPVWVKRTTEQENKRYRKINRMTPVLIGSLIIQGNSIDGLSAYSAEDGQLKWRKKIHTGVEPSAYEFKGRVYVSASDGFFYALDAKTGSEVWSASTKSENLSEPLFDDHHGLIYFVSSANVVYAYEADTGRQLWMHSRQDTSQFSIRGGGRPALKDEFLYVGFSDGSLVAFNAKTGSVVWENHLNKNKKFRDLDTSPLIDGDRLFIAGYDDRLYCLSTLKGDILWRVEMGGYSPLTLIGNKLFYPTSQGELWALNKENGNKLWTYSLSEGLATQVKAYKGLIVFGESQGSLIFLDPETGRKVSHFEPGRGILASPAIDEKKSRVYFISGEANLYAVDAQWGWKPLSSYIP